MKATLNKFINALSLVLFIALIAVVFTNFDKLSAINIWEIFILVGVYVNGLSVRMIHMSRVKMECLSYGQEYDANSWFNVDLGAGYMIPVLMEISYHRHLPVFIESAIDDYKSEDLKVPFHFKITNILLKSKLLIISSLFMIFTMTILPNLVNDYTLYRGLMGEELQMSLMGIASFFVIFFITLYNYSMYKIVEYSMDGQSALVSSRIKSFIMAFSVVFALYALLMFLFTVVFGLAGIELPILQSIINLDIVNVFIIISPAISLIQSLILKGKLSLYQYILNEALA